MAHGLHWFTDLPTATGSVLQSGAVRFRLNRRPCAHRIAILKALADPHRFQLLERIAESACPMGCAEARKALAISPATLSHHVKELEAARLVHVERAGKYIYLTLRTEVWSAFLASLEAVAPARCSRG